MKLAKLAERRLDQPERWIVERCWRPATGGVGAAFVRRTLSPTENDCEGPRRNNFPWPRPRWIKIKQLISQSQHCARLVCPPPLVNAGSKDYTNISSCLALDLTLEEVIRRDDGWNGMEAGVGKRWKRPLRNNFETKTVVDFFSVTKFYEVAT